MALRRRPRSRQVPQDVSPIVHRWLLRLLVPLGGHRDFVHQSGFNNDALAHLIGLGEWIDSDTRDFDPIAVRALLRKLHKAGELKLRGATAPTCLLGNVARLAELVGLSETDCRILEFAVLIRSERLRLHDGRRFIPLLLRERGYRSWAPTLQRRGGLDAGAWAPDQDSSPLPRTAERSLSIQLDSGVRRNDGGRRTPHFLRAGRIPQPAPGLLPAPGEGDNRGRFAPPPSWKTTCSSSSPRCSSTTS